MKHILLTTILAVALVPIIGYNVCKYQFKQRRTFEDHVI